MDMLNNLFKSSKKHELLLTIILVIYIVLNIKTPQTLANYIDTTLGNILVILFGISFFAHSRPLVGILGLFAAYILIRRSQKNSIKYAIENYVPSERRKAEELGPYNQFPVTLEEEVVSQMAPLVVQSTNTGNFVSRMDDIHDASPVDYSGVI